MARLRDSIPDRPANRDIRQLARILGFLAPYRRQVAIALVALVVAAGCVLVLGQGLRRVIDGGFSSGEAALLDSALVALLAVIVTMAIATYTRFYFVSWIGERVTIADGATVRAFSHLEGAHVGKGATVGPYGRLRPGARLGPGDLSGTYAGAQGSAAIGVGVGGNVLIGGSDNSIALQPLSVQGQVGLSVAAGLESLELRPGR